MTELYCHYTQGWIGRSLKLGHRHGNEIGRAHVW